MRRMGLQGGSAVCKVRGWVTLFPAVGYVRRMERVSFPDRQVRRCGGGAGSKRRVPDQRKPLLCMKGRMDYERSISIGPV